MCLYPVRSTLSIDSFLIINRRFWHLLSHATCQKRWTATAQDILDDGVNLVGDIFLSAAFVSYLGAFTGPFRHSLSDSWAILLRDKGIRVSEKFSLTQVGQ